MSFDTNVRMMVTRSEMVCIPELSSLKMKWSERISGAVNYVLASDLKL
jgi:hypothetical protein